MDAQERIWRERGLREAVLAGDEVAWRRWYDESCPGLFAYVLWRCGGLRDHAEEVLQETWLTAVRRLPSFDPAAGRFAGWLRGIAANVLSNRFRAARRSCEVSRRTPENGEVGADLLRREQAELVARALAALPAHYEAVLRARYLEGQSVPEIARERGESAKAVESLLTRARQAFRAIYPYDE
jgi:RNA polymerase sigma-70 factor (ECF subfamily)